jgi:hypothetical protein
MSARTDEGSKVEVTDPGASREGDLKISGESKENSMPRTGATGGRKARLDCVETNP